MVRVSIRQEFGIDEGRTLSVVDDIARKSPVIIEMTMSVGVNRMLGQDQAESKEQHLTGFVNDGSKRVGQDALECDQAFPN